MLPARSKVDLRIELRVRIACVLIVWPPPLGKDRHNATAPAGQDKRAGSVRFRLRAWAVRFGSAVATGLSGGALASGFGPSWSKRSLIAARRGSSRWSTALIESDNLLAQRLKVGRGKIATFKAFFYLR